MSHKFIYENNYEGQLPCKVEFEFGQDASLTDMLEQFTYYLKACGFHIEAGHVIDIVPEDGYSEKGWDDFFNSEPAPEDFNPRPFDEYGNYGENNPPVGEGETQRKKLWDATPQEWNNAYKSVTVSYDGVKYSEHE